MELVGYRKLAAVVIPDLAAYVESTPESKEFFETIMEGLRRTIPENTWISYHNYSVLKEVTRGQLMYLEKYNKTFWENKKK